MRIVSAAGGVILLVAACGGGSEQGASTAGAQQGVAPRLDRFELAIARVASGNPPRQDVVIVDASGGQLRRLDLPAAGYAGGIAWSPDGARIAYTRVVTEQRGRRSRTEMDVFVANADGSGIRRLTTSGRAFSPVWSPDGDTIVFAEWREGSGYWTSGAVVAVASDGSAPRAVTEAGPGRIDVPSSFSPDGASLLFTRISRAEPTAGGRLPNTSAVYVLDLASREERRLAERAADGVFSPDGRVVAFVSDRDENGELSYGDTVRFANELYLMDADGGDLRRLTRTRDLNERAPSWSPDAELLAYQRGNDTGNTERTVVATVRADGSCPRAVAFDRGGAISYGTPAWRPGRTESTSHLRCRPLATRSQLPPGPLAGNFSLEQARRYRGLALYWLGRRFRGATLSSIERYRISVPRGPGPVVHLHYGQIQLQLYHVCVRVPADIELRADGRLRLRRREAVLFDHGHRLELVTGKTTIVIFGARRVLPSVVRALRPLNPPLAGGRAGSDLPPPAPGARTRRVRCR